MTHDESELGHSSSDVDAVIISRDDVSNYNPEQILPLAPEDLQKIRSWLQPTSYDTVGGEYRKHLASHVAGTGAWLASTATYQDWMNGAEHGMLWIKGIPGSGKSVMAANLIKEIAKSNPGCPVLYFFFRQIIDANHEPQALLRDWMDQLLHYSPPLQEQLMTYVNGNRSIDSLPMEDMFKDLRMAFASLPQKVFAVGDALDEMDRGHDVFLQALGDLGRWRPETVKILITSRPVPGVEMPLRNHPCLHLRLEESLVDVDISTYVRSALSSSEIPQSSWKVVADAVPGRANGLFLYAKLAMDAFLEHDADITAVLAKLPADLNALYTGLLKEHAERSAVPTVVQHLILATVTHSTRPLRLLELAEMIRVYSPDGITRDLKTTKELIRSACGPLVEILADETVSVIHHSFTEYLMGTTGDDRAGHTVLKKGPAHTQLALACLCYLLSGHAPVTVTYQDAYKGPDTRTKAKIRLEHPFNEYAANNWYRHINGSEAAGCDQSEINAKLRKYLGQSKMMQPYHIHQWPRGYGNRRSVTPAHVAAQAGLISYTKELLKTTEVDARDRFGRTPLYWAASEGHVEVARELIAAGANPDHEIRKNGAKPLHAAVGSNHSEVVEVLLDASANPLTSVTKSDICDYDDDRRVWKVCDAPLKHACKHGLLETVNVFIPFIKDSDVIHQALAWAAWAGRPSVVARILQHPGVDVNIEVKGKTPLFLACGSYDLATITILLEAGANPNHKCGGRAYKHDTDRADTLRDYGDKSLGYNCMHRLCGVRKDARYERVAEPEVEQRIFSLLLQHGADIHLRYPSGETALHGAAAKSPVLTRLLLDGGADANAVDDSGQTPLFKVQHADSVVLLVEQGQVDINIRDADGKTPLLHLLSTSSPEVVVKLLQYEPDCDVVNSDGVGAIHIYLEGSNSNCGGYEMFGNLEIIKALIAAGADPNQINSEGATPILMMRNSYMRHLEVFDLLLQAGANIDAMNKDGETLLFQRASLRHTEPGGSLHDDLSELINRGASPSSRDFKGRTMLHSAVYNTDPFTSGEEFNVSRFGYLHNLGLDIMAVDYRGNGLLHELALHGHEPTSNVDDLELPPIWEHLLSLGLDLERRNFVGRTPLHLLCATTHATTVGDYCMGSDSGHEVERRARKKTLLDHVIARSTNIGAADQDGVTALHLAVTMGQTCTKKLLDAGADPTVMTHEGLTPLHLACRCRDPNVVGLLLDALRRRQAKKSKLRMPGSQSLDEETLLLGPVAGINAKTRGSRRLTPLYYACRSGRPETVALLLEAGADMEGDAVLAACVEFEVEDALWRSPQPSEDYPGNGQAVALKLHDKSRRGSESVYWWLRRRDARDDESIYDSERLDYPCRWRDPDANETTRLAEILDMATKYGLDITQYDKGGFLSRTELLRGNPIEEANSKNREYTAMCLTDLRTKQKGDTEGGYLNGWQALSGRMHNSLRAVSVQVLRDSGLVKPGTHNWALLHRFLVRREYHLIEELHRLGGIFLPTVEDSSTCGLSMLIKHGLTSLFETIGTLEAASQCGKGIWHAFGDSSRPGLWLAARPRADPSDTYPRDGRYLHVPFILEAVRRAMPNLDILRLLVEKFDVDVNESYHTIDFQSYDATDIEMGNTALHSVACGDSWWKVHQALPYLLKAGADVHARNDEGQTPLHQALGYGSRNACPFAMEAVKILVASGADVNAVDRAGQSCLALAVHNVDMVKYLICNGAIVTTPALLAAVDNINPKTMRVLLSTGVDPNARQEEAAVDGVPRPRLRLMRGWRDWPYDVNCIEPHQIFPLYYAAWDMTRSPGLLPQARKSIETRLEIVQALLDHGADPFSRFLKPLNDAVIDEAHRSGEVPPEHEEVMILHQLLSKGYIVDSFLDLPGLDVNRRDPRGQTLLHAACIRYDKGAHFTHAHGNEEEQARIFKRLLSLGADLTARDNSGRNVLHHMIITGFHYTPFKHSITYTLAQAPGLLKQADSDGKTPLHYAVSASTPVRDRAGLVRQLLAAGADPLAVTKDGDTVLHSLAHNLGHPELRTLFADLVSQGLNINARNDRGETPVFSYCLRGRGVIDSNSYDDEDELFSEEPEHATPMLLELGTDFFARDSRGRGLMHVAASGDATRFKGLMGIGLDIMLEDKEQRTPLDIANASVNDDVLELFDKDGGEERRKRRGERRE